MIQQLQNLFKIPLIMRQSGNGGEVTIKVMNFVLAVSVQFRTHSSAWHADVYGRDVGQWKRLERH